MREGASEMAASKVAGSKVAGAAGMMDKLSNYIIVDIGANLTNKGQILCLHYWWLFGQFVVGCLACVVIVCILK